MKTNIYRLNYKKKKNNNIALKENNSNEELITGAAAIQIVLAMSLCLPYIACRISYIGSRIVMGRLIKATNAMAS